MFSRIKTESKVVGLKQSRRAIAAGQAVLVYIASDAAAKIRGEMMALCRTVGVQFVEVPTMAELGSICGVNVGAAIVTIIKPEA